LIQPAQRDDVLLADIGSVSSDDPALHCWWLGQSGFLLQQAGARVLFDPYLSDSLTLKYAATDKPHVRMTAQCLAPERLAGVPLVLSSHQHTDHFDEATLRPLALANPRYTLVVPAAVEEQARGRLPDTHVDWHPVADGQTLDLHGWRITGIPAAHNEVERDEHGRCRFLGFVVERGGFAIYHSGDTLLHPGLLPALAPFRLDLALVPINGNVPARRVSGNLNGVEAAELSRAAGARLAVPHHFEMFEFNTASPESFVRRCQDMGQPYEVMRCGARVTVAHPAG
jgi:L-ascorbate metabolism protein UlaG (beta-lactamase superfamily)